MVVSFVTAFLAGAIVYKLSLDYNLDLTKASLRIAGDEAVKALDDQFTQMEAVSQYLLSDPSLLSSITLLGLDQKSLTSDMKTDAKGILVNNISTYYVTKYTYRTIFFNQNGIIVSSKTPENRRVKTTYDPQDVFYVKDAAETGGKTYIVKSHRDFWSAIKPEPEVYSLVKPIFGHNTGYIEMEQLTSTIPQLLDLDEAMKVAVYVNGDELLYSNDLDLSHNVLEKELRHTKKRENAALVRAGNRWMNISRADKYDVSVVVSMDNLISQEQRSRIVRYSFLIGLFMFGIGTAFVIFWAGILNKPIVKMIDMIEQTNLQNLDQISERQEDLSTGSDEFQRLSRAYQEMTQRLNLAILQEKKASTLQLQALFDSLQAQVNPHFLYNVLNILSARGVQNDDEVICEICGALAAMLRYSTGNKTRYATVREEMEYLENYFYLLKIRFSNKIKFKVLVLPQMMELKLPKAALQQVIENSVKHGFSNSAINMEISMDGEICEDRWVITVTDNGVGFSEEALAELRRKIQITRQKIAGGQENIELEIGGLGLVNAYARSYLLYGDRLIFELENRKDGRGAEVRIGVRDYRREI